MAAIKISHLQFDVVEEVEWVGGGQGGAAGLLGGEEAVVGGDQVLEVVEV